MSAVSVVFYVRALNGDSGLLGNMSPQELNVSGLFHCYRPSLQPAVVGHDERGAAVDFDRCQAV